MQQSSPLPPCPPPWQADESPKPHDPEQRAEAEIAELHQAILRNRAKIAELERRLNRPAPQPVRYPGMLFASSGHGGRAQRPADELQLQVYKSDLLVYERHMESLVRRRSESSPGLEKPGKPVPEPLPIGPRRQESTLDSSPPPLPATLPTVTRGKAKRISKTKRTTEKIAASVAMKKENPQGHPTMTLAEVMHLLERGKSVIYENKKLKRAGGRGRFQTDSVLRFWKRKKH